MYFGMKFICIILSVFLIAGCSNNQLLTISNYILLIGSIMAAVGTFGRFYYHKEIKNELKQKSEIINENKIHDLIVDSENHKEWLIDKDAIIILELIDIQLDFCLSVQLKKGDKINMKKISTWDIDGEKPFGDFCKDWEEGNISTEQNNVDMKIYGNKFLVKDITGKMIYRKIHKINASYQIIKKYLLTNTNSLPNSKEIKDFQTKKNKRIFTEEDLIKFNTENAKIYNHLNDIPEQSGNILRFRLKPKIRFF